MVGHKQEEMRFTLSMPSNNKQTNLTSFLTVYDNWHKQVLPGLGLDDFLKKTEALASHVNIKVRKIQ